MCIAVPGKVIFIDGNYAKVDFNGNALRINVGAVSAVPGDFVLVHAGCAIDVLSIGQAQELIEILAEIEGFDV